MEKLTKRQQQTKAVIRAFMREHGYAPTVRELARAMDIDVRAAFGHILALERKGAITRDRGKSRSITLHGENENPDMVELPVLGTVPAGEPLMVPENIMDTIPVEAEWFGRGELFVVRVEGESMTGAHIMPGDYVVVKAQREASDGDIIVGVLEGEVTIKRLSLKKSGSMLLPENPLYFPIKISGDFRIAGKVVGVIRKY